MTVERTNKKKKPRIMTYEAAPEGDWITCLHPMDDLLRGERKKVDMEFLKRASGWRGLLLPMNGSEAGEAIIKFKESGILKAMMEFSGFIDHPELSGKGVERFWRKLAVRIEKKCG